MTSEVTKTPFQRVVTHPHNIEAIASFIPDPSKKEMAALPAVCKALQQHFFMKQHMPFQYEQSRYPLFVNRFTTLDLLKEKFELRDCNPFYLRELMPGAVTPAWEAFTMRKYDIVSYFLEHGGLLAVTGDQKRELSNYYCLFVGMPAISAQIRNVRWDMADSKEKKQAMLQATLEEYCLKGCLREMRWVFRKAK